MKKIIILALSVVVLAVFLTGCAKQEAPADTTTAVSTDIDDDMSGFDELDIELDITELDSIDQELADLENLFS